MNDQQREDPVRAAPGRPAASSELLPLVYAELRRLAARSMPQEPAGDDHQPPACVHGSDPRLGELVKLRCCLGMTIAEAATALGVTPRTLNRDWVVARAWLRREWGGDESKTG